MPVIVVMPCLNEEASLRDTCASLGFGRGDECPAAATLILVDNGSSDSTLSVAEETKLRSPDKVVQIGEEPERGFVPARLRGNTIAGELIQSSGWDPENVLILQVDADCRYDSGYIETMRLAMETTKPNVMIEACMDYPPEFKAQYSEYVRICDATDAEFEKLFPASLSHDNIVVDAVSGYRMTDYLRWGGHRREFDDIGEEIYAETTRLFMSARALDGQRFRVTSGRALHSPRKALGAPALHMATAGFPRSSSWERKWLAQYDGPESMEALCARSSHPAVLKAIRTREEHLLALFGVLPLHVDRALGQLAEDDLETRELAVGVLPMLPQRTTHDLASRPGMLISDIFNLISEHGEELLNQARVLVSRSQPNT